MSVLGSIGRALTGVFGNLVIKPLGKLLASLIPKPKIPGQADPVYQASVSNNVPKPGDPVPRLFGTTSFFPPLGAPYWTEYVDNRQIVHALLVICDGPAQLLEVTNNRVPFSASASVQIQLALPGERTTLAPSYVYLNPDINTLELAGGALDLQAYTTNVSFDAAGTVVINSTDEVFGDATVGGRFTVTGSASNDAEFIIDSITDAQHITAHRVDAAPLVTETVDCTINVYVVVIGAGTGWAHAAGSITEGDDDEHPDILTVNFDNGDGTTGTIELPGADYWGELAVGDLVQSTQGANAGVDFELLTISGAFGIVRPAPVTEVGVSTAVVRVRRRLGPFALCAPGQTLTGFNLNAVCNSGLFRTNKKGKLRTATVSFEPQIQRIDDAGNALGPVVSLGEFSMSARAREPQRQTFPVRALADARYQLYLARTTPANDDSGRSDALAIESVVSFITVSDVDPDYSADTTRLALTIQASAPLNGDLQVRVRARGMHPLWDADTQSWTEPQPTEDIAPAWSALLRDQGREVDTDEWTAAHLAWQAKGWKFHAYLTGATTLASAVEDVLRAGDARRWYDWRRNLRSMWRDRPQTDPVLMLHDGNVSESSLDGRNFGAVPEDAPTGFYVQYTDARTGDKREVLVGDADRAQDFQLPGVQSRQQAYELGYRELMRQTWRRQSFEGEVLWIQRRADFGKPALVQNYALGYGQVQYLASVAGRVLEVQGEFEWDATGPHRVWLVDREGQPAAPIDCTRGAHDRQLVLATPPLAYELGEDGGDPTVVVLGYPGREPQPALIAGVGASDADYRASVTVLLDAPEVYADPGPAPADEFPASGEPPDLEIDDFELTVDGEVLIGTWTKPAAAVATVMEYRRVGDTSWTPLPPVLGGTASVDVMGSGDWQARVYALGPAGTLGPLSDPDSATTAGLPLSVTISPTGTATATGSAFVIRGRVWTATVVGGTPPYTGGLVRVGGDTDAVVETPGATVSATRVSGLTPGTGTSASFRFEYVDSLGAAASSATVTQIYTRINSSGPSTPIP